MSQGNHHEAIARAASQRRADELRRVPEALRPLLSLSAHACC